MFRNVFVYWKPGDHASTFISSILNLKFIWKVWLHLRHPHMRVKTLLPTLSGTISSWYLFSENLLFCNLRRCMYLLCVFGAGGCCCFIWVFSYVVVVAGVFLILFGMFSIMFWLVSVWNPVLSSTWKEVLFLHLEALSAWNSWGRKGVCLIC